MATSKYKDNASLFVSFSACPLSVSLMEAFEELQILASDQVQSVKKKKKKRGMSKESRRIAFSEHWIVACVCELVHSVRLTPVVIR